MSTIRMDCSVNNRSSLTSFNFQRIPMSLFHQKGHQTKSHSSYVSDHNFKKISQQNLLMTFSSEAERISDTKNSHGQRKQAPKNVTNLLFASITRHAGKLVLPLVVTALRRMNYPFYNVFQLRSSVCSMHTHPYRTLHVPRMPLKYLSNM